MSPPPGNIQHYIIPSSMKPTLLIALGMLFLGGPVLQAAAPHAEIRRAKRTAITLFSEGKGSAAVAHLRAVIVPEIGADGTATALTGQLIDLANHFYNRRELTLAGDVLSHAFEVADPILKQSSVAPAKKRAALVGALGVLTENILADGASAESLYAAAAAIDPSEPRHRERLSAVKTKLKPRTGPGRE